MSTNRLEAFSDGVIAVIITIMVLGLQIPHGSDWNALRPLLPPLGIYILSFIYIAIYWNNHHHMFYTAEEVNGAILWANLHLLFWLSLIPWVTAWMGENHFASVPVACYGWVMLMSALAYIILQTAIIRRQGPGSCLKKAIGNDLKGKASGLLYAAAIPLAFLNHWISITIYIAVALLWLIPDRRIESILNQSQQEAQ